MNIETMYNQQQPGIKYICNSYSKKTGIDIDEFLSLSNEVFVIVCNSYDNTKAKFSTYFQRALKNSCQNLVRKNYRLKTITIDNDKPTLLSIPTSNELSLLSDSTKFFISQLADYFELKNVAPNRVKEQAYRLATRDTKAKYGQKQLKVAVAELSELINN